MTLDGSYSSLPILDQYVKDQTSRDEGIPSEEDDNTATQETAENAKEAAQDSIEQIKVLELQSIDSSVRAHEAAHLAAGGGVVTGGANFSYVRGPDGKMYATGGEVPIDVSEGNTPDETIQKAQRIRAAALAPSDPSPQDYQVASSAILMEQNARLEKTRELQEEIDGTKSYQEAAQSLLEVEGIA